jgi:hypothetical protein
MLSARCVAGSLARAGAFRGSVEGEDP